MPAHLCDCSIHVEMQGCRSKAQEAEGKKTINFLCGLHLTSYIHTVVSHNIHTDLPGITTAQDQTKAHNSRKSTYLFTDKQVGKAMPFSTDFPLYTLLHNLHSGTGVRHLPQVTIIPQRRPRGSLLSALDSLTHSSINSSP